MYRQVRWHKIMEHEKLTTKDRLLFACAIAAFVASLCFGVAGFIVPPMGEVHDTVLWLIAQLLLFTASAFGIGAYTTATRREYARFRRFMLRKEKEYADEPEEEQL